MTDDPFTDGLTADELVELILDRHPGLDLRLGHVVILDGQPYVTRDGLVAVAHATGELDGLEVVDEGETDAGWWARVSVHRRGYGHPFTYRGRYSRHAAHRHVGPEMAVKCAEAAALRRAFDVAVPTLDEREATGQQRDAGTDRVAVADAKRAVLAAAAGDVTVARDVWGPRRDPVAGLQLAELCVAAMRRVAERAAYPLVELEVDAA